MDSRPGDCRWPFQSSSVGFVWVNILTSPPMKVNRLKGGGGGRGGKGYDNLSKFVILVDLTVSSKN